MVRTYKTTNIGVKNKFKGKWCAFEKEHLFKYNLGECYKKPVEEINLDTLYGVLVDVMKKLKFVFFEEIEAKPILNRQKKVIEVWINYWYID